MTLDRCTIALERMARLIQTAQVWQFTKGIPKSTQVRDSAIRPKCSCVRRDQFRLNGMRMGCLVGLHPAPSGTSRWPPSPVGKVR